MTKGKKCLSGQQGNDSRNLVERQRRDKISNLIAQLKEFIPSEKFASPKPQIHEVLAATVDFIQDLLTTKKQCETSHCKAVQDVEASYYKSQNQQLRTLLRHAGLSELQEFQLIAALSEETTKAADINLQINNDENNENEQQTTSNGAIDDENDQANVILDLSSSDENSASDGPSSTSMSLRKRPGNILSLTKQVAKYDQNVWNPGSDLLSGGWTKNHVNTNELFDVPPDIKQFLRQKMIEIVYRNSSNIFLQLTNALTQPSKVCMPEKTSHEQTESHKAGEKSQVLDLSTLNQIKIGGKVVRLARVKQVSCTTEQVVSTEVPNETVYSIASTQATESEAPQQELNRQPEDPSSSQTTEGNDDLKSKSNTSTSQQSSFVGNKIRTTESLSAPSVTEPSCETRVSRLPSIFSIAHLDDDNNKVPTLEEIDSQLQADVSLENAIRSSTLFDIDSLIANNEDSNPYAMNTSDSFDPRDQGESVLLRSETVLQESVPYDSTSVFSIRNLTNELYESQTQSQRYPSNVDVPVNRTATETEPKCKSKHAVDKGRKDASNVSAGKASAHSVEAMIMPSRGNQQPVQRDDQSSERSRELITVKGGKELRYLVEDIQSNNSSNSSSKRKLFFDNEKSSSGCRNDAVLNSDSVAKKQKLTSASTQANAAESSHVDKSGAFSSTGNQYASSHQTLVANGPLPFWEENMVVMPPHGYSNSFTSSQNSFAYPVTPQAGREAINQYNGINQYSYGSNYYESGNQDYSSSSISNYRPGQTFIIPPPGLSSGYPNELSEPGKYFNTPNFSNFNQPLGSAFNYNSSSSSTQQPLEPEMLLQPLTPNEKWNTFRQSNSFSGFKDVEFMARNSAGTSNSNNTQSGSQSTFNPFLEPTSSQPFAVDPMQYQYSFPYPPPITEKSSQLGQSRRGAHDKQSQRESVVSGHSHRSSYQSTSGTTKNGSDSRRGNSVNSASSSSQSSSAPRHLIKNFVQSKSQLKTHAEPSSDRREGNQTSKTASGIQPHPPNSNANQFSWNSPSMEPFSISSSNFLFSNTELPF